MSLHLQDPSWSDSDYLLEHILEACTDATAGHGAFAFASAGGVRLLLRDATFTAFLSRGRFDLIIGVESFTDTAALDAIAACQTENPQLNVSAYLGEADSDGIFHPKLCWFVLPRGGVYLVGSGNLTVGGLRGNCEAFTHQQLAPRDLAAMQQTWRSWRDSHTEHLLSIQDPRVRAQAHANRTAPRRRVAHLRSVVGEDDNGNVVVGHAVSAATVVLIAEIPRSGDRWNQANFDLDTFQAFFGASPGRTQRIVLVHVNEDGTEGQSEVRPSVAVSSHNFRFELDAASGRNYPSNGRPIAVFVRVGKRTFRYRLCMPGTASHLESDAILSGLNPSPGNRVRRAQTTVGILRGQTSLRSLL